VSAVLTVNAGSSSLKFALYPLLGAAEGANPAARVGAPALAGVVEGLEPRGAPRLRWRAGAEEGAEAVAAEGGEGPFDAALRATRALLGARLAGAPLAAVAHRVVHGGERWRRTVALTPALLNELDALCPLAPLHQPHNLAGARAWMSALPGVPQVACFDTAFHATLPPLETTLALSAEARAGGVRRYGFHGLSYQYVSEALALLTPRGLGRVVMAHLGNGASVCAAVGGESRATSMGFSALDGLMMGTRCGALDPGVLLHLLARGWDAARLERLLYRESGLLGVSGESADMRALRQSGGAGAALAASLFAYRVRREVGAQVACVGGLDVLAFAGGIGERDPVLRAEVCEGLSFLGLSLDPARNASAVGADPRPIHAPESAVEVWVVPTDEGRVAAVEAVAALDL